LNDRVELSLVGTESSFVTLGSMFTGVKRFPLHPMVNYEYFMLCLKNLFPLTVSHRVFEPQRFLEQ